MNFFLIPGIIASKTNNSKRTKKTALFWSKNEFLKSSFSALTQILSMIKSFFSVFMAELTEKLALLSKKIFQKFSEKI
jgi:hypothetical protein